MNHKILHRWTNSCLWEGEADGLASAIRAALASGAVLRGADLRDAVLRGAVLQDADLRDADLRDADLRDAVLRGADLRGAVLRGADLRGADLRGADLRGADLRGADLRGADLRDAVLRDADGNPQKIARMRVFTGLYDYQVWAVVMGDGTPMVRMGCQWRSVDEWDRITIRKSKLSEFPDDGSERCEDRVRAFDFARAAALRDSESVKAVLATAAP